MRESRLLDVTPFVCPTTFVKVQLELEEMQPGEEIDVRIREGESLSNVARTVEREGHQITEREDEGNGIWRLRILKA